jgi:hypothetical protein
VSRPRPIGQRSAGLVHQRPVSRDGVRIIAGGRVPCPAENRAAIADGRAPGSAPRLRLNGSRQGEAHQQKKGPSRTSSESTSCHTRHQNLCPHRHSGTNIQRWDLTSRGCGEQPPTPTGQSAARLSVTSFNTPKSKPSNLAPQLIRPSFSGNRLTESKTSAGDYTPRQIRLAFR